MWSANDTRPLALLLLASYLERNSADMLFTMYPKRNVKSAKATQQAIEAKKSTNELTKYLTVLVFAEGLIKISF